MSRREVVEGDNPQLEGALGHQQSMFVGPSARQVHHGVAGRGHQEAPGPNRAPQ